jgi:hypothetical protein
MNLSEDTPTDLPQAPLELDPCALQEWLEARPEWVISIGRGVSPNELSDVYHRYVSSKCRISAVLCEIAAHPNTPTDILAELHRLGRHDSEIDHALACNPNISESLLVQLAHSPVNAVLEHVIWHPRTPAVEIERLTNYRRSAVVRQWARNALAHRHQIG